jgi:alkanesulfonate monooxygenase SsuD/methylene tetrahydromethanopterin reductase-like flavin-dependent oxidoreductase (luciferase family)
MTDVRRTMSVPSGAFEEPTGRSPAFPPSRSAHFIIRAGRCQAVEGPLARDYRDYFLPLLGKMRGLEIIKTDPAMPDSEVTLPYLLENIWIVGDPDTVAAKLRTLGDQVGGFGTLLVIAHEWRPRAAWERSMTLLREQVLPRLSPEGGSPGPLA